MTFHLFAARSTRTVCLVAAMLWPVHIAAADPPMRVARVSYLSGSVSFRPSAGDDWTSAALNYPLTAGDHVWTDRTGRAELEWGPVFVRLAPATEFSIVDLGEGAQLRITQGTATVRVRSAEDDGVEIDTPNCAIVMTQPGFYRIDVAETGVTTSLTVRTGGAAITTGGEPIKAGVQQTLIVAGLGEAGVQASAAAGSDDFEDWSLARDRRAQDARTSRYVSPQVIGYEDLDEYGVWQNDAGYGAVWMPRVRAEWVPYREGHWSWVNPWGWTWIDDAPWGFAPFHYGRWTRMRGGWGWIPGQIAARPVYAPALVGFVGGSGWQASLSLGTQPVAWFPLGPREAFVPAYRVSDAYVRAINVPHVRAVNVPGAALTYVNRDVAGAVTAVPRDTFVRARPVAPAAVSVPREVVARAPAAPLAALPRQLTRAQWTEPAAPAPPQAVIDRAVVVRHAPSPGAGVRVRETPATNGGPGRSPAIPPNQPQTAPAGTLPQPAAPRLAPAAPRAPDAAPPVPPPAATSPAPPAAAPPAAPRHLEPAGPRPAPAAPRAPDAAPPVPPPAATSPAPPAAVPPAAPGRLQPPAPASGAAAQIAARHAHENADLAARQAAERAQLQAAHQQALQRAKDPHERGQLQQRHQDEQHALQARHQVERESQQKRHEVERQQAAK